MLAVMHQLQHVERYDLVALVDAGRIVELARQRRCLRETRNSRDYTMLRYAPNGLFADHRLRLEQTTYMKPAIYRQCRCRINIECVIKN